jgi:hypothetical protein
MHPDDLLGEPCPAEHDLVDLGLPFSEPWTCPRADVAALVAVKADLRTLGLKLNRLVVLVTQDVEWTDHNTSGAPGAQAGGHDLVEEVTPLGLVSGGRHDVGKYMGADFEGRCFPGLSGVASLRAVHDQRRPHART